MAMLLTLATGVKVGLCAHHLVGRSPRSELVLPRPVVSSDHAIIRWTGSRWEIRDLGSRNGTWIDGRRLTPNEPTPLQPGRVIAFGHPDERFRVLDVSPPTTWARPLPQGTSRAASDCMLALPDDEDPRALVYGLPDGRWVVEQQGVVTALAARTVIHVDGNAWEIHLGEAAPTTADSATDPLGYDDLAFQVAVEPTTDELLAHVVIGEAAVDFAERSFCDALLGLARARLKDQAADAGPAEAQGWVDLGAFAAGLGVDEAGLGVQLFRARRRFSDAGAPHPSGLFERRSGGRELRLGFRVRTLPRPT